MPQKKNPDLTELIRAKVGRINGAAQAVTLQLKGLPLAYNKDMQETQEPAFAVEFVPQMLNLVARFTAATSIQSRAHGAKPRRPGYLNAMAAATYLVHKGVPFRTAHEKIGNAVRFALEKGVELGDLTIDELHQFGEDFGEDFFAAITLRPRLIAMTCSAALRASACARRLIARRIGCVVCENSDRGGLSCWCVKPCFRTPPISTTW